MKTKLLYLLSLISLSSFAQTPCINGFAGIYPCNNVDLMSNLTFTQMGGNGTTRGNDCWGWTDPLTNKEYAIMCCTNLTAFIDITNPAAPVYLGKVDTHNGISSTWRDVKVYNNHAFIVSESNGHGMQVFDLKRLRNVTSPQTFAPDARYDGFGRCHNIAINEATGYAYCVGTATFSGGPHVLNILNPTAPVFSFGYSSQGYTHDAQVVIYNGPDAEHIGKEIYFGCNENKVVVLDVTNKNNPILLSTFFYPNIAYTHQGWLTENQKYFIIGDELDESNFGFNTRSVVIDMTDLDNPTLKLEYFGTSPSIDHNGYTKNNKYHLAAYRSGYRIMEIGNINNGSMNEVGFFDTYPANNSANFNGAWSVYPYFPSGTIIVSDIERGLFVVRLSGTLSVEEFMANSKVSLAPNPAKEFVTIQTDFPMETLEVFDVTGKLMLTKKLNMLDREELSVSGWQKGLYFVKVNNSITQKLLVN